jgi:hypothetical protein
VTDAGFRTPLLDMFKQGGVAADVRLQAARGELAPRAHEQVDLLVMLVNDPDPEIAGAAETTLARIPGPSLAAFLGRADVPGDVRAFFQARGLEPRTGGSPVGPDVAPADRDAPLVDTAGPAEPAAAPQDEGSILQRLSAMNVAQRLTRAMKGNREERAILIRDPNRIVAAAVLSSPKLTETEVESIAKMANVSDEVLRIIANTRAWVKNYQVVLALAKNPKTPVALSMNLLSRLTERDLRNISTDRNVPDVLRVTARKKLVMDK